MFTHTFKITFCLIFFTFLISGIHAQEFVGHKEVGLGFTSLNLTGSSSFSAFYKKERKMNEFFRLNFFTGNLDALFRKGNQNRVSTLLGIGFGKEKRRQFDEKLWYYFGPQCSTTIQTGFSSIPSDNEFLNVILGLGYVFGLQHQFNNFWAMNIEIQPGIYGTLNSTFVKKGPDSYSFSTGINNFNNSVRLNILRRF